MPPRTLAVILFLLPCLLFVRPTAADEPKEAKQPPGQRTDAPQERRLDELEAKVAQLTKELRGLRNDLKAPAPAPEKTEVKTFLLKSAEGTRLTRTLQEFLGDKDEKNFRIICDVPTNRLLVRGSQEQLATVEQLIVLLDVDTDAAPEKAETKIFTLKNAEGTRLAKTLLEFLGDKDGKELQIVCDPQTNSLLVRGSRERVEIVKVLLDRLDVAVKKPDAEKREDVKRKPR
jgi:type II secretory pathway component GspD/PulD (secretin)